MKTLEDYTSEIIQYQNAIKLDPSNRPDYENKIKNRVGEWQKRLNITIMVAQNEQLPRTEHAQTHLFVRLLWRTAIAYSVENKIGALLSDQLNNNMSVKPLFQYKKEKYQGFEVWT